MKLTVEDDFISPNEPLLERETDFAIISTDNNISIFGYLEPNTLIMTMSDTIEKSYNTLVDVIKKWNELCEEDEELSEDDIISDIPEFEEYLVGLMVNAFSKRYGLENSDNNIHVDIEEGNTVRETDLNIINYFKQSINYYLDKILDKK